MWLQSSLAQAAYDAAPLLPPLWGKSPEATNAPSIVNCWAWLVGEQRRCSQGVPMRRDAPTARARSPPRLNSANRITVDGPVMLSCIILAVPATVGPRFIGAAAPRLRSLRPELRARAGSPHRAEGTP